MKKFTEEELDRIEKSGEKMNAMLNKISGIVTLELDNFVSGVVKGENIEKARKITIDNIVREVNGSLDYLEVVIKHENKLLKEAVKEIEETKNRIFI